MEFFDFPQAGANIVSSNMAGANSGVNAMVEGLCRGAGGWWRVRGGGWGWRVGGWPKKLQILPLAERKTCYLPPVGFTGNLSLLEICVFQGA